MASLCTSERGLCLTRVAGGLAGERHSRRSGDHRADQRIELGIAWRLESR